MGERDNGSHWTRHIFHRSERARTTWKFRFALAALILVLVWMTRSWWTVAIGRSLVCEANAAPSDAVLVENFDPDHLVFERATALRRSGMARRVLVPVPTDPDTFSVNEIAAGIAEVMAKMTHLGAFEMVPIREVEPISLNAAGDVLQFLSREHIRSIIVVSPVFRSKRSALVYAGTLGRAGITITCEPALGTLGPNTWTRSWHGVQDVAEQWIKLQYYRLYVLPFRSPALSSVSRLDTPS